MKLVVRIVLLVSVVGACIWGYWYAVILPRQLELGVLNEEISEAVRTRAWDAASLLIRRHRLITSAPDVVNQWQGTVATGRSDDDRWLLIFEQVKNVWDWGSAAKADSLMVEADTFMTQRYDSVYSAYWSRFSTFMTTTKARIVAEHELMATEKRLRNPLLRKARGLKRSRSGYFAREPFLEAWKLWADAANQMTTKWALDAQYESWYGQVAERIEESYGMTNRKWLLWFNNSAVSQRIQASGSYQYP